MAASSASVMTLKLQEFAASNGRLPNDVTELDSIKSYGPSHRAPVGYKFVIDAKQKQVMAVKE